MHGYDPVKRRCYRDDDDDDCCFLSQQVLATVLVYGQHPHRFRRVTRCTLSDVIRHHSRDVMRYLRHATAKHATSHPAGRPLPGAVFQLVFLHEHRLG